jgi:flagellar M-ring protein FliF
MPDGGVGFASEKLNLFDRDTLIYVAEWVIPIVLALGAIFIALRPVLRRGGVAGLPLLAGAAAAGAPGAAGGAGGHQARIAGGGADGEDEIDEDETVTLDQVAGRVRMGSIAKVAARIDENPRETVFIIRNWLAMPDPKKGA